MRTLSALSIALAAAAAIPGAATAQISVLSSTVEERTAAPGESYTSRIVIANPTRESQTVRIYQTDYRFLANGTSNFDEAGTQLRSNAKWVTPQSQRLTVPAGGEIVLPYSVKVPAADSLRGTYWSAIMVEGATTPPAAGAGTQPQLALGSVVRYAIQVATHIGTGGNRTVKFDSATAVRTDRGAAAFDLDVINTGQRGYRPSLWIEVYDAQGALRASGKQSRGLLYPETSLRQHFDLGPLPAGSYKAVVFADTGDETVFAGQFTIKF